MKKDLPIILLVVIIIGFVTLILINRQTSDPDKIIVGGDDTIFRIEGEEAPETSVPVINPDSFTLEEVALHADETDCYSVIDGVVYDFTDFINKHPGGSRNILRICGIDGSEAYNNMHGRSQGPKDTLTESAIGILTE